MQKVLQNTMTEMVTQVSLKGKTLQVILPIFCLIIFHCISSILLCIVFFAELSE